MEDKLYREVSVTDRLPKKNGNYFTKQKELRVSISYFEVSRGRFNYDITAWLEEINLDHIQDKRELTATFLVNSIRLLDEQGARHLVNELIERFHLLPTKEQINKVRDSYSWCHINPVFKMGWRFAVKYILESLKGVSND